MNTGHNPAPQSAPQAGAIAKSILRIFLFTLLGFASIDIVLNHLILGISFSFGSISFLFRLIVLYFISALVQLVMSLPAILAFGVTTLLRWPKFLQILFVMGLWWGIRYSDGFSWGNYDYFHRFGFDLSVNGDLTRYGLIFGTIFATCDVMVIAFAFYIVLWRKK